MEILSNLQTAAEQVTIFYSRHPQHADSLTAEDFDREEMFDCSVVLHCQFETLRCLLCNNLQVNKVR